MNKEEIKSIEEVLSKKYGDFHDQILESINLMYESQIVEITIRSEFGDPNYNRWKITLTLDPNTSLDTNINIQTFTNGSGNEILDAFLYESEIDNILNFQIVNALADKISFNIIDIKIDEFQSVTEEISKLGDNILSFNNKLWIPKEINEHYCHDLTSAINERDMEMEANQYLEQVNEVLKSQLKLSRNLKKEEKSKLYKHRTKQNLIAENFEFRKILENDFYWMKKECGSINCECELHEIDCPESESVSCPVANKYKILKKLLEKEVNL